MLESGWGAGCFDWRVAKLVSLASAIESSEQAKRTASLKLPSSSFAETREARDCKGSDGYFGSVAIADEDDATFTLLAFPVSFQSSQNTVSIPDHFLHAEGKNQVNGLFRFRSLRLQKRRCHVCWKVNHMNCETINSTVKLLIIAQDNAILRQRLSSSEVPNTKEKKIHEKNTSVAHMHPNHSRMS